MKRRPKAKTAYELLERVCEAIKARPLSYYQGYWKARRGQRGNGVGCAPLPFLLDQPENTCGTAFCRAGWMVVLHDGLRANPRDRSSDPVMSWERRARQLLDMPPHLEFGMLVRDDVSDLFDAGDYSGVPGTPQYVKYGIDGLRAFMKTHEKHLKARSLRGV
jgi:hypothetical protein